jgi:hypothetical protein
MKAGGIVGHFTFGQEHDLVIVVRRGFRTLAGERCGDHLVSAYLARVNANKRQFLRFAAGDRN